MKTRRLHLGMGIVLRVRAGSFGRKSGTRLAGTRFAEPKRIEGGISEPRPRVALRHRTLAWGW